MNQLALEVTLHWVGVGLYALATALLAHAVLYRHPERVRWGQIAAGCGLVAHGAALLLRWSAAGHGPYMMKYEVLSSNAWIAVAVLLVVLWRRPDWSALGLVVLPASLLMVGLGLFAAPGIRELPPSLRSVWLVFHISFAKLSAAAFLLSVAAAVLGLVPREGRPRLERVPSPEVLDALVVRTVGFGFLFWTVTIAAGAIWAEQSWGRYWGWDLIETWSLVTWLVYGIFLHVRLFFKLRARATAWWAIGCFVVFVLTLLVLPFLMPSLHAAYFQ